MDSNQINEVLTERGSRYGDFTIHANITQTMKRSMRAETGVKYDALPDYVKEALEMVCHKIGRIVNGDPFYEDSYVDIIGYTQLALDAIREAKQKDERKTSGITLC